MIPQNGFHESSFDTESMGCVSPRSRTSFAKVMAFSTLDMKTASLMRALATPAPYVHRSGYCRGGGVRGVGRAKGVHHDIRHCGDVIAKSLVSRDGRHVCPGRA